MRRYEARYEELSLGRFCLTILDTSLILLDDSSQQLVSNNEVVRPQFPNAKKIERASLIEQHEKTLRKRLRVAFACCCDKESASLIKFEMLFEKNVQSLISELVVRLSN